MRIVKVHLFVSSAAAVHNLLRMVDTRREQQEWIRAVVQHLGVTASELARRANRAPSTINRFLNDPDYDGILSPPVIADIAKVASIKPMEFPGRRAGFGEVEAVPFEPPENVSAIDGSIRAIRELCSARAGRDPWRMQSAVLDMAGILPGDVIIVDLNKRPKSGDLVCAQVYDWRAKTADTIMRLYDAPFLVSQSHTMPSAKPLMVDDETVVIKGVIDAVLRVRQ